MNNKNLAINLILSFFTAVLIYSAILVFPFLVWVAFVPLFFLVWRNSFREVILFALLVSFLIAIAGSYWVASLDRKYFYYFVLYICSFFFLFIIFLNLIFSKFRNVFSFLIPGFLYVLIFEIYALSSVGAQWFNLAILQPRFSFLIYWLKEAGMIFIILTVNALLFFCLVNKKRLYYIIFLVGVIGLLSLSYYYGHNKIIDGRRVRVAVIQGNFSQDWDWREENSTGLILEKYFQLSRQAATEKPDLIIWPEYAVPTNLGTEKEVYQKIAGFAKELKINLIIGSTVNDGLMAEDGKVYFFDSAFAFDRQGELIGRYDALYPFPYKTSNSVGEGYLVFETDAGRVGITICYDELYEKVYRDYDKLGVDFFVSISNNAPVKNYFIMRWRKYFAELRASSYKKNYIQVANTGYSQVIDPFGNIIESLPIDQEGYMVTDIYLGD